MSRSLGRRPIIALAALGLPGCTGLIVPDAPKLFTLTPKSTFDEDLPVADWQLLIEPPFAAAALNTVRVAYLPTITSVDYFAGVAWTDVAPQMVQTLVVESFENSGRIVAVGRETVGLRADFVLSTELREFQAQRDRDGALIVNVNINAKLIGEFRRSIVANMSFSSLYKVNGEGFDAIIAAFDEALGKVLRELVGWTLRQGNAAFAGGSASAGNG